MPRSQRLVRKRDLVVKLASENERKFLWENRKKFDSNIELENFRTFVAVLNGRIVGFCQTSRARKNIIGILRLGVINGMRKKGIGRLLIGRVEGYYIKKGIKVFFGVSHAKKFFERTGHKIKEGLIVIFEKNISRKPAGSKGMRAI